MDNFQGRDRAYDRNRSYSRDRDQPQKYKRDKSYIRDKLYDRNSYSRDRSQDYCRDVYKEENHKYKRRSRNYYEDIYEDRHSSDKYKHQYRDDKYDKIRDRLKENPCSHGDKSCDSFYAELEELYSGTITVDVQDIPYFAVEVGVQDLHNLPTKIIDGLELSDICLIEQYLLDKEEMEAQEMEECIAELPNKQEIDREMIVLPKMPVKTSCEQEECVEMKNCDISLPELFKAEECVHIDKIEIEKPEINAVEIKELHREIKLEKCIELDKSKLHPKWKKVLTSRAVKRSNPVGLEKGKTCRPPPKPPDRENSLNLRHETKKGRARPYENKKGKSGSPKDRQGTKLQAPSKVTLYNKCQWRSNRNT